MAYSMPAMTFWNNELWLAWRSTAGGQIIVASVAPSNIGWNGPPSPPPPEGSTSLGNGQTLEWHYTTSSGTCGPYNGTFTAWYFSSFTYVDASGDYYPVSGSADYFISSQGLPYCPPAGPQPAVLPLGPTGADGTVMINFTAGSGGGGSATITHE